MTRKEDIVRLNQEIDAALANRAHAPDEPGARHTDLLNRLARTDFTRHSGSRDRLRRQLLANHPAEHQRKITMKRFTPILRATSFGAMLVLIVGALGWLLSNAGLTPEPAAPAASPTAGPDAPTEVPLPSPDDSGPLSLGSLLKPLTFEWVSGPAGDFFYVNVSTPDAALGQIEFGSLEGGWCDRSANGSVVAFAHSMNSNPGTAGFAATLRWASLHDLANIQAPFPDMQVLNPPTFSPSGFRLAFSACPADGDCGLFIYDLETGQLDRISPYQPPHPVLWSPDGAEIAFQIPSGDQTELHVISAETGETTFLGDPADAGSPLSAWGRPLPEGVTGVERCEAVPGSDEPVRLSLSSSSEDIRLRLLYSQTFWQSMWADAVLTDTSGALTSSQRTQIWLEQPARARVLNGTPDGAPAQLWISDGERTRTGETLRIEKFEPPTGQGDAIYPHPMTGILPTPLSGLLFPTGFAQRGGTYLPVEMETIAGREALVVDWQAPWGDVVDRFWVDTVTGVILRQVSIGKDGSGSVTSDYSVTAITYNQNFQPSTFNISASFPPAFAENPGDIFEAAPTPAPEGTPETSLEFGEIYMVLETSSGFESAGLVHFPAACLLTGAACPQPEFVAGTPEGFAYSPRNWSPDQTRLVYELSGPDDEVWIYDRAADTWSKLDTPYFSGSVWSPDGAQLAGQPIISGTPLSSPIVIARVDGSGWQEVLGEEPGFKSPFGWADDHTLLYVNTLDNEVSDADPTVYAEIQQFDLQTGAVEVLAGIRSDVNKGGFGTSMNPLSPDRTRIVYTISDRAAGTMEVHIFDLTSRTERTFSIDQPGGLSWAPDSRQLLVQSALGYSCSIGLVELDGSGHIQIYNGDWGGGCQAVWSPDGNHLLVAETTLEPTIPRLTIVDIATGEARTLSLPDIGVVFDRPRAAWLP